MNCILDSVGKSLCLPFYSRPIFVVGSGRSGTSVLLQALGQHPSIVAAPGEAPLLTYLSACVRPFEFGSEKEFFLTSTQSPTNYLYEGLRKLSLEGCFGPYFGLSRIAKARFGKNAKWRPTHWAAKTFPAEQGYESLRVLFPDARFVFIVRNGIEVVHSMTKFHGFSDRQFEEQCRAWVKSYESFRYLIGKSDAIFVRHENFVSDGAQVIRQLLRFLKLAENAKPIDFINGTVVHPLNEKTKQGTDAKQQLANRANAYEQWSDEQRSSFHRICGTTMQELGYPVPF